MSKLVFLTQTQRVHPFPRIKRAQKSFHTAGQATRAYSRYGEGKTVRKTRGAIDFLGMPGPNFYTLGLKLGSFELRGNVSSKLRSPCLAS